MSGGNNLNNWRDYAACTGIPTEMFFAEDSDGNSKEIQMAKQICVGCPVRKFCLAEAFRLEASDASNRHGIWGGYSPRQRRNIWSKLLKQRTQKWCAQNKHILEGDNIYFDPRYGTPLCRECKRQSRRESDARRRSSVPIR